MKAWVGSGCSGFWNFFNNHDVFLIFQISFDGIYANMRMVHILTSVVVSLHFWKNGSCSDRELLTNPLIVI